MICRGREKHRFDAVIHVDKRDIPIKCRFCKAKAARSDRYVLRGFSAREEAARAQAFVAPCVYKGPDGTLRFPGHSHSSETKRLEARGFQRIELNTTSKIRQFEASMNKTENAKYREFVAARDASFTARQKSSRDELRAAISTGRMVMVDSDHDARAIAKLTGNH
jgi:hypothetical protein